MILLIDMKIHHILIHSINVNLLLLTFSINIKIYHILIHSINVNSLLLTLFFNIKIYYIPFYSNFHNYCLNIFLMIIEYSNIKIIFFISFNYKSLLSSMMNVLRAFEIAKLFKTYFNQYFIDIFIFIIILNV